MSKGCDLPHTCRVFARLPAHGHGQCIGLFGGSFDPAHDGHLAVSEQAIKRLALGQLWWLFSPQNPLKAHSPAPLADRLARARGLVRHPRIRLSPVEACLATQYTIDTLRALQQRARGTRFVLVMGADSFAGLHRWHQWRRLLCRVPVAVFERPGWHLAAMASPAARFLAARRLPAHAASRLARHNAPVWCYLGFPGTTASSSAIRRQIRQTMAHEQHLPPVLP